MLDRFSKDDLAQLVKNPNDPCVTIFLPTRRTGREIYKAAAQLKQLTKTAARKLTGHWMSEEDAESFLRPLLDLARQQDFWRTTENGLALFLDADGLRHWRVSSHLADQVFVSNRFFVRPVIDAAYKDGEFFILAISRNSARLYRADEHGIEQVEVSGMPSSVDEMLNLATTGQGSQLHTGSREHGGKQASVYHGNSGKSDSQKKDLQQFFRQVDQALNRHFNGKSRPLILACVGKQASIYSELNNFPGLLKHVATGGVDQAGKDQILARALPCMAKFIDESRASAIDSFRQQASTTRSATETSDIVAAAHRGQIDKLFVHESASIPGGFDAKNVTIEYGEPTQHCDQDLVEISIAETLTHRGDVLVLSDDEMPVAEPMVAMLRY